MAPEVPHLGRGRLAATVQTHPLWNPFDPPSQEEVRAARVQPAASAPAPVEVVTPDPAWPGWDAATRQRVIDPLGDRVLALEHVGSTAVPGLRVKPVIDVDLTVEDRADETDWLPRLQATGFELRVREPDWEQHRMRADHPPTNFHVFGPGAREPQRRVLFRGWLLTHPDDRDRYATIKQRVATQASNDAMLYNNAKAWVYDIYETTFAADPTHRHDPQPRLAPPARQ